MKDKVKRIATSLIEKKYSGYRIDNYLSEKYDYHSRNIWQQLISDGVITVNNTTIKQSKTLKIGDMVEFIVEDFEEPECNLNYNIIYEDKYILAVNKPFNCIIHPVGPFFKNTLTYKLEEDLGYSVYSINRLDRETTGIVLFGKDSKTAKNLSNHFIDKKIHKEYIVAVHGLFPKNLKTKGYLLQDKESFVRKKRKFQYEYPGNLSETDFETSETDFELIQTGLTQKNIIGACYNISCFNNLCNEGRQIIPGSRLLPDARENHNNVIINEKDYKKNISLVKVILKTGRQHQIRATLCSLGFPVIGDKLYGIDDTMYLRFIERKLTLSDIENLLIQHQALHACKLIFLHPLTQKRIKLEVPPPLEINKLFNIYPDKKLL